MKRISWPVLGTLVLFAALFSAGCTGGTGTGTAPAKKAASSTYTIGETESGDWGFPSPYGFYPRGPGSEKMMLIFDSLTWRDDTGIVPALASKWTYNASDNSYTLELRNDVKWTDGQPFTSKDVVFTFEYTRKHPYPTDSTKGLIGKVVAQGDYGVKISLLKPSAAFVNNTLSGYPMIPEHVWATVTQPEKYQDPKALIGTGPYQLVNHNVAQATYLYKANPNYFQGKPKIDQLRYMYVNTNVAVAALKKGDIDACEVTPSQLDEVKAIPSLTLLPGNYDWLVKMMINQHKAPYSTKEFRQALAYAIDRNEIVKISKMGKGLPGSMGLIPPDSPWYNTSVPPYAYDPAKTKALLGKLGYTFNGTNFTKNGKVLEVNLLLKAGKGKYDMRKEAAVVKQDLEKVGIKTNLTGLESKTVDGLIQTWKFDLAITGHGGLEGDADLLPRFMLDKGFNSSRYTEDKGLVKDLNKQSETLDEQARKSLVATIQTTIADDAPVIPLSYPQTVWASDGRVPLFYNKTGFVGNTRPTNKEAFWR